MINQSKIMNPQAFINIFGKIPNLNNSEILDVQLNRDGPTLFIRIMTREPVLNKPSKWIEWDYIYIEMSFFNTRNLSIDGLGRDNTIDKFEIKDIGEDAFLKIICNNKMQINCIFDWGRVERITPGLIGLSK